MARVITVSGMYIICTYYAFGKFEIFFCLHITVSTTSAILGVLIIMLEASHRSRARLSLVVAVIVNSLRDSRPSVE